MSSVIGGEGTARRLCTCDCALCQRPSTTRARRVRQPTSEGRGMKRAWPMIRVSPSGVAAACGCVCVCYCVPGKTKEPA